ncbi:hypothetical protein [Phyllobacterium myrsinacearum]|nr:hypothetical protein [Phyllobacterium myrsinacearum]PWV86631.1 hypothetical protein DEV92_11523 [Phyllobacterium myrsinacearum]RZU97405.1 hypothetical protein EV654_4264 [Phyllobacterium myrsinacearum]
MKLSLQITVEDLIRTLRWCAIELREAGADASRPAGHEQDAPDKRKPVR